MSLKKITIIGFSALVLVAVACFETKTPSGPEVVKPPVPVQSFGTFRVQLIPENPELSNPAYTNFVGMMKDGPIPPVDLFTEVKVTGQCKLFKKFVPYCQEACPSDYVCVADDSCMREPSAYSVGNITLTGMKTGGEPYTYESVPGDRAFDYQINSPYPDYPPANEGDTITLSAAGKGSVEPFTIKVPCISPLVVKNDEIVLDGKDITLEWEPPKVEGISTMSIRINLSYHGGTKGEIQCETEDDGSVTIPGALIDELKSYGTAGYPCVYLTRQAVAVNEAAKAKATVECTITKMLTIPGEKSCSGNEVCPEGKTCIDRKCQ